MEITMPHLRIDPPSGDSVFITEISEGQDCVRGKGAIQENKVTKRQRRILKLSCLGIDAAGY